MPRFPLTVVLVAMLSACALDEPAQGPGDVSALAVARVQAVEQDKSSLASLLDLLGPLAPVVQAGLGAPKIPVRVALLTQTGEHVLVELTRPDHAHPRPGDCVGIVPLNPNDGLRAHYGADQARLLQGPDCGTVAR